MPRDGSTLATAPATEDARLATTPFFDDFRFEVEPDDRLLVDFDARFVVGFDLLFAPALDFVAFFAIADSLTPRAISTGKWNS